MSPTDCRSRMLPRRLPCSSRVLLTAWAVSFAACGARSELRLPDGSVADVAIVPSDTPLADATPDVPTPIACRWTARSPVALTTGVEDHALESVIYDLNAVLVGWQISDADPPHDQTWRLQRFGFDGSQQGGANGPLPAPPYSTSYGGISAAYGSARDGAIAWDESHGCMFVPITIDGAVNGTRNRVGDDVCGSLVAFSNGFTFLSQPAAVAGSVWALTVLDPEGRVTQANVPLTPPMRGSDTARRAVLPDGTFVLLWTERVATGVDVHTRRFTILGAPAGDEQTIAHLGTNSLLARPITVDSNVVLAWIDRDASGTATASLATVDSTGRLSAPPVAIRGANVFRDAGLALAYSHGAVVVAWTEGEPTRARTLFAQPFDLSLAPIAPPLTADHFFVAASVRMVPSPDGVLVVYEAESMPMPMQIYATPVVCVR